MDIVNDDENLTQDQDLDTAMAYISDKVAGYECRTGVSAAKVYVSDEEELQSYMMYAAQLLGIKYERTHKKTYVE